MCILSHGDSVACITGNQQVPWMYCSFVFFLLFLFFHWVVFCIYCGNHSQFPFKCNQDIAVIILLNWYCYICIIRLLKQNFDNLGKSTCLFTAGGWRWNYFSSRLHRHCLDTFVWLFVLYYLCVVRLCLYLSRSGPTSRQELNQPINLLDALVRTTSCWDLEGVHISSSISFCDLQLPITPSYAL